MAEEKRIGRPKGSLNRRTLARLAHEARMDETEAGFTVGRMTEPETMVYKMRWWLNRFAAEQRKGVTADMALMEKCLDKAQEAAIAAAPYHHARLSALMVGGSIVTKIQVEGGMPSDFEAPASPTLPPGTVVTAEDALPVKDAEIVAKEVTDAVA